MSSIKLKHSGGNGVSIASPDTNPASDKTVKLPATNGTLLTTDSSPSFRNLIINGAFNVAQRSASSTSGGYASVDRFKVVDNNTNVTITQSQHALTSSDTGPWAKGFRNSWKQELSAAGNGLDGTTYLYLVHLIEGQDIACSGWDYTSASSYITLSFWFKASTNQTFYGRLMANDGTTQNYPFSFTATGNDTWTKITKTIPGASNNQINNDNGAGLKLEIALYAGADRTDSGVSLNTWAAYASGTRIPDMANTWITAGTSSFELTGVQLEVGEAATEFEHRSYGEELRRCHRYYYRIHPTANGDVLTGSAWTPFQNVAQGITFFPVDMRTRVTALEQSGTAAHYQVSSGSGGGDCRAVPTFQHGGLNCAATSFTLSGTPWTVGDAVRPSNKTTDGFLAWSAEL